MEDSEEEPAKEDPAEEETDENNPRSKAEPTVTFDLVDLPPVSPLRNSPPLKPSQNLLEESLNEIDDVADCFGDPIPAEAEEAAPEHSEATPEHSEAEDEATAENSTNSLSLVHWY